MKSTKHNGTNSNPRRLGTFVGAAVVVGSMVFSAGPTLQAGEPDPGMIVVQDMGTMVTFAAGTSKAGQPIRVRISGPDGETVFESRSEAGLIDWAPDANTKNGKYHFDAWAGHPVDDLAAEEAEADIKSAVGVERAYRTGLMRLEGGMIIELHEVNGTDGGLDADRELSMTHPGFMERVVGNALQLLVSPATAQDVVADGANPDFILDDTDAGDANDWEMGMDVGNDTDLEFDSNASDNAVYFSNTAGTNALFIEPGGDVGLGTATPAETLDIVDTSTPGVRLDDTSEGVWTMEEFGNDLRFNYGGTDAIFNVFRLNEDGSVDPFTQAGTIQYQDGTTPLLINAENCCTNGDRMIWAHTPGTFADWGIFYNDSAGDEMYIQRGGTDAERFVTFDFSGFVGIGEGNVNPSATLHVQQSDGTAEVLVEDLGSTSPLTMFRLKNDGFPTFRLEDASRGFLWDFRLSGTGAGERFEITQIDGLGPEFQLFQNGDAEFVGDVTANGVVLSSSRELKADFSTVDEATVLEKVAALDVSQWRYKRESGTERHIGPMAEDFQALFGLGDGKHISVGDANGILFAATKALKAENEAKDQRIAELEARLARIEEQLAR